MARVPKLRRVGLVASLVFALAGPAMADPTAWNQEAVTKVALQLRDASNAWQTSLKKETGGDEMTNRLMDLQNQTRMIRDKSVALSAQLEKGKPRDHVVGEYLSLREVVDDARVSLNYVSLEKPALDAWANFDATFQQITPYFDAKGGN